MATKICSHKNKSRIDSHLLDLLCVRFSKQSNCPPLLSLFRLHSQLLRSTKQREAITRDEGELRHAVSRMLQPAHGRLHRYTCNTPRRENLREQATAREYRRARVQRRDESFGCEQLLGMYRRCSSRIAVAFSPPLSSWFSSCSNAAGLTLQKAYKRGRFKKRRAFPRSPLSSKLYRIRLFRPSVCLGDYAQLILFLPGLA